MGEAFQTTHCTLYKMSTVRCVCSINQPCRMSFLGHRGPHLLASVNIYALVKQSSVRLPGTRALARGVPHLPLFSSAYSRRATVFSVAAHGSMSVAASVQNLQTSDAQNDLHPDKNPTFGGVILYRRV